MVLFIVSVCWYRGNRYITSECKFFWVLHQNRAQNIIQCHDNKIWKHMCILKISYSTETYLRYNVQRIKMGQKYMWDPHHELVLSLQSRNCFRCVPDNEIKGGILGWTTSKYIHKRGSTFWSKWWILITELQNKHPYRCVLLYAPRH